MSNILVIKHGSLGDLIQANGAIQDIKEYYKSLLDKSLLDYISLNLKLHNRYCHTAQARIL